MNILDPSEKIEKYIFSHSTPEDRLLAELNRETQLKVLNPRMISGALQGKLLEFISRMICPQYILEIGTFTGYSAICLAKGLPENGKLITIEINDELTLFPEKYFEKAGVSSKIELLTGNALTIIPTLPYLFDLVYIDADKNEYLAYYHSVFDKVIRRGFIVADNVLWNGKVVDETSPPDKETRSIIEFNNYIRNDPRIENVILPVRDGISIIRKL